MVVHPLVAEEHSRSQAGQPKVAMDLDGSTHEVLGETLMITWHDRLRATSVDFVARWWTRSSLLPM